MIGRSRRRGARGAHGVKKLESWRNEIRSIETRLNYTSTLFAHGEPGCKHP